jgi:uncharacterized RmlC-like cupin family protein
MRVTELQVVYMRDTGDERGRSYSPCASWPGLLHGAEDLHLTTVGPGCRRGDHYHKAKHELIIVQYRDRWSLHWDRGEGTSIERHSFKGEGAVVLSVPPLVSHTIRNDGGSDLHLCAISDRQYDPELADAFPRMLMQNEG